ncbi:type I-E CRISPR-associated protein Cas5/CasD [Lentilactobacillus raoultii]|uniref:Type I-E CRISPR-associated protein Cas5/CasD n=1 Tax=Lentilactobacillus raoultii TaxID=1987503 RepID=A0ABW3PIV0_9LACO|nr:type I-E CRISPR-associated protein Cas5/CasD [Lentilactobacillus raoultii]
MTTLIIRLTAPLQSYGDEATFARRTTGDYPSKSAVIGMVAAALGYHRDDPQILKLNQLHFAVRVDQPGTILTDYQTVEWRRNTRKVTYRDYLQDAVFVVALGSDDRQVVERIKNALKHPRFQLFLGRRSNVPAGALDLTVVDSDPVSALESLKWQASKWYQKRKRKLADVAVEIIADAHLLPESRSTMVRDRVVSFDQRHRQHGYRPIAVKRVRLKNPSFQGNEMATNHDIMKFL